MSKIVQADNINAGQYYLNGYPLHYSGGGVPHTMLPVGSIIMWNGSAIQYTFWLAYLQWRKRYPEI